MIAKMSEGELIGNNKIIALFMGWKKDESGFYPIAQHQYDNKGYIIDGEKGFYQGDRPLHIYHKSWDWLMPVIDKIESLGFNFRMESKYEVTSDNESRILYMCDFDNKEHIINLACYTSKIDCVYGCIIKFIEWHKLNKNLLKK